jgi:HAD superfamily hydrolase (TIGR01490 family)
MDHTLIDNDCDVSWKTFMVTEKLAPPTALVTADKFYQTYLVGKLDQAAFASFQLNEFVGRTESEMAALCQKHFVQIVKPTIYPDAEILVKKTIASGAIAVLLTATNRMIAKPLADYLGIKIIVATELELDENGRYTGRIDGIYAAAEGKLAKAEEFCRNNGLNLGDAVCYGDSINDRFLLAAAGTPVVVNPGSSLIQLANKNGWKIINF